LQILANIITTFASIGNHKHINMRCLIIDDELISCRILQEFIRRTEGLELVGTYNLAVDAISDGIDFEDINLVFLDVEMPEMSGFDFINNIEFPPQIIIVSSKENYAVEAFNLNVVDFLLKPVVYSRFLKAVKKVNQKAPVDQVIQDGVFLRKNNSFLRVKYNEIAWIEAVENHVMVYTQSDKYLVHQSLKTIESKLPPTHFRRIHRSYIVNVDMVKRIEENEVQIGMEKQNFMLPMGKMYKENLINELNSL